MITKEALKKGVEQYGTPMYVFDLDEIRNRTGAVRDRIQGIAGICFAMKANPFLTGMMSDITDRIEVCSLGEYQICKRMKIRPDKLLISGVLKKKEELNYILDDVQNSCVYTAESIGQFQYYAEWSEKHKKRLQIYLRLSSGNQFGMDEQTVLDLISVRDVCPMVDIAGLHYFSGTRKRRPSVIQEELEYLDQFILEIEKSCQIKIRDLEYGPGLDVPYFIGQKDCREEDLEILIQAVRKMSWSGSVVLEMGRFLVSEGGYYLTGIGELKRRQQNNYCIVDGGIHQLHYDGQIQGMYQPKIQIIPERNDGEKKEWMVCGSLCTENDVLCKKLVTGRICPGDTLVFGRTGAYSMTEGMAMFLSHPLPNAAFYSEKNGWELVRTELPTYLWNMERGI